MNYEIGETRTYAIDIPLAKISGVSAFALAGGGAITSKVLKKEIKEAIAEAIAKKVCSSFVPILGWVEAISCTVAGLCLATDTEGIKITLTEERTSMDYLGPGGTHSIQYWDIKDYGVETY